MAGYPKWLYHPTQEATVVEDEAAHKALGHGWVESPVEKKAPPAKGLAGLFESKKEAEPEGEPQEKPKKVK